MQSFTNFSNGGAYNGLQFFKNCSSVSPLHGVQSFRNRVLQCWSPDRQQVLPGMCTCIGSSWAAASFRAYTPAPSVASLMGCTMAICFSDSLQGLQENLHSSAWSTIFNSFTGVCRAVCLTVAPFAHLCLVHTGVILPFLKYYQWDPTNFADGLRFRQQWSILVSGMTDWLWLQRGQPLPSLLPLAQHL